MPFAIRPYRRFPVSCRVIYQISRKAEQTAQFRRWASLGRD
jgi:hypothetical protein